MRDCDAALAKNKKSVAKMESHMKIITVFARLALASAACLCAMTSGTAWAENDQPLSENWAPSEWGAEDRAGSVNRTTPDMVLSAAKLIKQGKVATLGKVYQYDAPTFSQRSWKLVIPGLPTGTEGCCCRHRWRVSEKPQGRKPRAGSGSVVRAVRSMGI